MTRTYEKQGGSDTLGHVVNRDARAKAASLIRSYLDGKINNHEFAAGFPRDKADAALKAIETRLWFYYDDLKTHYSGFSPHSGAVTLFRRCALFLDAHLEYEWPKLWHHNLAHPIVRILLGQAFRSAAIQRAKTSGDYAVWPFFRRPDFERARDQFSAGEVTADVELPKLPLTRSERLLQGFWMTIQTLQAVLFFGAIASLLWGAFGHPIWVAAGLACLIFYLLLLGVARRAARLTHQSG